MASSAEREPHIGVMDSESPRMASRIAKFAISLLFYPAAESWRVLRRAIGKTQPPHAVVIYYHHVPEEQRERFAHQLDHLQKYTTPMPVDLADGMLPGGRYSIVTADDGWKSFADNAIPELARRKIPVAMFAISERLGRSVDGITFDRLATAQELRALDPGLITIGSHTATHVKMTALDKSEALRELRESRIQLESILGREVGIFCFPYGDCSDALFPFCREAGYHQVFTCMPRLALPSQFVVGRVRVDPTDWPLEFHLKLMGAYRWLPMAVTIKRRLVGVIRGGDRVRETPTEIPAA